MRKRSFNLFALMCGIVLLVTVACNRSSSPQSSRENTNSQPIAQATPIDISADELIAEAQQDKAATDAKYKDKEIFIIGASEKVTPDPETKTNVLLFTNLTGAVACYLKNGQGEEIKKMMEGADKPQIDVRREWTIALKCRYDRATIDKANSARVRLSECEQFEDFDENKHPRLTKLRDKMLGRN